MSDGMNPGTEPAQLVHERDVLGYHPWRVAGLRANAPGVAALHRDEVRLVRKAPYSDYHALTFALGGAALYRVDAAGRPQEPVPAGTLAIQPAEVESYWESAGPTAWLQFYLSTSLIKEAAAHAEIARAEILRLERRLAVEDVEVVRVLYGCARRMASPYAPGGEEFDHWSTLLAQALLRAHPARRTEVSERLSPGQLGLARDYIAAHLGPGLTAARVAAALKLSRFHFTRGFTGAMGESPYHYIQRERLRAARRLVALTDQPFADIACDLGYASQSHMTAVFTSRLGASPGVVRNLARGVRGADQA